MDFKISNGMKTAAIILAAGKGVRMNSSLPKALFKLSGRYMIDFLIEGAKGSGADDIIIIGGYKIALLKEKLTSYGAKFIEQTQFLGSADAVKRAKNHFRKFKGTIIVLYTDTPLIKPATLKAMLKRHAAQKAAVTFLTANVDDAKEYGRVSRNNSGKIRAIVEHADTQDAGRMTQDPGLPKSKLEFNSARAGEINVGAYCFDSTKLFEGLENIKKNKKKNEYYLTDIIAYFYNRNYNIDSYTTNDNDEALGINRREDLALAEDILRKRTTKRLFKDGVTIKDPANTYIEDGVKVGKDTVIYPFVVVEKDVIIGRNCHIGPFAHLRRGSRVEDNSSIGNFVEIVRTKIGKNSRAKHLTYLGDTIVGKDVNIGAGTITANYDGKNKYKTIIKDKVFIGSGTTIVAPVIIGKSALTGAGSLLLKNRNVAPNTVVAGVPAKPLPRRIK